MLFALVAHTMIGQSVLEVCKNDDDDDENNDRSVNSTRQRESWVTSLDTGAHGCMEVMASGVHACACWTVPLKHPCAIG